MMQSDMAQPRWKSPVAWTSLGVLVFFVAKNWFGLEIPGWDDFVTLAVASAAAFGILNNPTSREEF